MKNEKKNKQGEPAMTQLMGANELSDDVLEAATGGARLGNINGVYCLWFNEEEMKRLRKRFGDEPFARAGRMADGEYLIDAYHREELEKYKEFLDG